MSPADANQRPNPYALLGETSRDTDATGRGRLKIFLGAAPGVGKTYEMLSEAGALARDGVRVLAGLVETHGRSETEALLRPISRLPRRRIRYRGRHFEELDLDGVLSAAPALALIDELAHGNVPGCRHEKRWQDVEELLDAGINVFTTLNIQHLASLNDVVLQISRIRVRETVPDNVLDDAHSIEVVDLPPDELIQRLHDGKVYVPEQAARAVEHFFSRGNLAALREMALRAAAERVDADVRNHLRAQVESYIWPAHERLLVVVGEGPVAESMVRLGKRLAERRQASWITAHIKRGAELTGEQPGVGAALRLAESLGGEIATIVGFDLVQEIKAFARNENVTEILVGRSGRLLRWFAFRRSLAGTLLREADEFIVTLAPRTAGRSNAPLSTVRKPTRLRWLNAGDFGWVIATTGIAALVAWPMSLVVDTGSLSLIFVCSVLLVAVRRGVGAATTASLACFVVFNFLFTNPRLTLTVYSSHDVLTLVFFLIVSLLAGNQAARIRNQMTLIRASGERNARLYDFSRRIAGAVGPIDLALTITEYLHAALDLQGVVLYPSGDEGLAQVAGEGGSEGLIDLDHAAARWVYEHNAPAGRGTGTLSNSWWFFMPLSGTEEMLGVIGVAWPDRKRHLSLDEQRLLFAVRDQSAVALGRSKLAAEIESAQFAHETSRLRAALLSSVSHDLRTPLSSIIGSTTLLRDRCDQLEAAERLELLDGTIDEAGRLDRFVQNLLDMTRVGYGALTPELRPCPIRQEAEAAWQSLGSSITQTLAFDIAYDARFVLADSTLLRRVLANLLDNAAKYSSMDSNIVVETRLHGHEVCIAVCDAGPGISATERDSVFDMFYRVEKADHAAPGTGLGLAICKELTEIMCGRIRAVYPGRGLGTRIEVVLPLP
ncbi:MAG: sensor histidine kinase KdpD [Salinisphaera sp.]|jgi:two-component system sensor histidine kinase KdpD|nr:sensor histidine kinase KdpD [Salinisphaera sp.]